MLPAMAGSIMAPLSRLTFRDGRLKVFGDMHFGTADRRSARVDQFDDVWKAFSQQLAIWPAMR